MEKIKVLFLAANPKGTSRLRLDEEIRAISQMIRVSEHRDLIEMISAWAVRPDDLLQLLNEHKPQIVHFSGHGSYSGELILVDEKGKSKPVGKNAIKALFETLKDNIRVVILNACFSKEQTDSIKNIIDCTIGMNSTIGDQAAITFAASFYRALGFNCSVQKAFEQGKVALLLNNIQQNNIPELICKPGIDPSTVFLLDSYPHLAEAGIASRMITFLEGRRVLYGPIHKNCPGGIIQTIKPVREKIAYEMESLDRKSHLYMILSGMRTATLEFLNYACKDCETPETCDQCTIPQGGCADGLMEYRKKMGIQLAEICLRYRINIEGDLASIIPSGDNNQTYGDERIKP